ncbi:helix-turn-helix domain-containing protein [Paenibacillus sp. MWE-103]|uniref:Helix-turn-helix domain-containing protein n=1 Tax=Paenibacillus artemisiicola TaxID=1172618 RepID=A0ABS3WIN0_9BACL|nr:AraC family transcriptional regulator [Paenibacillus artemisiicola]MBO7748186.1 helix-turn-helix domain-containing protein [Paenibacillus artemisiicola]
MNGKLDFFFYKSYEAGTYVDYHKHSCYELVYYVSGSGAMNLNGRTLAYAPGTMTLTRPDYMHDERHDEATDVLFFGFRYDDVPVRLRNGLIPDTAERTIHALLLTMKEELLGQKAHYAARADLLLNEIVLLLGRQAEPAAEDGRRPERLFYARRYLDENFTQPVQLRALAELSGYGEDHFRHLFKAQTGCSPGRYVLRKRLEAARELLRHTTMTVSAIGLECGFSTTSQFIGLFRRELGMTPLQFRKEN